MLSDGIRTLVLAVGSKHERNFNSLEKVMRQ